MKLDRLEMVNRHAAERSKLLHLIAVVEQDPLEDETVIDCHKSAYRILIDGELQDGGIRALLRPILMAELWARVRMIELDLAMLGVSVE